MTRAARLIIETMDSSHIFFPNDDLIFASEFGSESEDDGSKAS